MESMLGQGHAAVNQVAFPGTAPVAGSHESLDRIFESKLDCVKLLDSEGRLLRINACAIVALEISDPSEALGTSYFDFWSGDDRTSALNAADAARKSGSGRFYGTYRSRSGRISIWDEVITCLSCNGASDSMYLVISRDLTELRSSLLKQRATTELSMLALREVDFGRFLQTSVERLSVELGCPLAKVLQFADTADELTLVAGVGWDDGLVGQVKVGIDHDSQAGFTLLVNGPVIVEDLRTEMRFSGPPLLVTNGVISGMSTVIVGPDGRPFGVLGAHTRQRYKFDTSDLDFLMAVANIIASRWRQEAAQNERRLLLREMTHRSGNLLQVVNSIFSNTVRDARDVSEAKSKFSKRLGLMARANALLSRSGYDKSRLREVLQEVLEPFGKEPVVSGRDIMLDSDLCFDLSLVLFELATSSAKYGALGGGDGVVQVQWELRDTQSNRCLSLLWTDTSTLGRGPSKGTGFGMKLISTLVEDKHSGKVTIAEAPYYQCELLVPVP
jgi:two-component sensor histidine kinase